MKKMYFLLIGIVSLTTIVTFTTYAMFDQNYNLGQILNITASSLSNESNIMDYEVISIEAGKSKTIDFNITNSTANSLYYGVWYEMVYPSTINSNISIGKLTGSTNAMIGQLATNQTKLAQIAIINNSSEEIIINIGVGYSNTSSLNLSTGRNLITGEVYITLADKIISLSQGTSWSSGANGVYRTNSHEYRYVGANVNNWVRFNNDDYRIIGVFDSNSTGVSGNLVKLIKARPLGGFSWGATNTATAYTTYSTYTNNWETANANILLNEYFLNASSTSSTYKSCSDWTYYYSNNGYKTKDCSNIIGYGIQTSTLRNYIQPVTWYLKGYNSNAYSKQNFYTCERSDTTTITNCTSGNSGGYATKVTNKSIGLMYVSDYMYASGYYSSSDTSTAAQYYYGQQNWLYRGYEWTITPVGSSNLYTMYINTGEIYVNNSRSYTPVLIRPTFYLKSTIKIITGNGAYNNPYIIST